MCSKKVFTEWAKESAYFKQLYLTRKEPGSITADNSQTYPIRVYKVITASRLIFVNLVMKF